MGKVLFVGSDCALYDVLVQSVEIGGKLYSLCFEPPKNVQIAGIDIGALASFLSFKFFIMIQKRL